MSESLSAVMRDLLTVDTTTERPDQEEWEAMIERIKAAGVIHKITKKTYWYFLEVLPPKWFDGRYFAFAEGSEPLQLFWELEREEYLTRSLTWNETERFCEASGLQKCYWG